MLCYVFIIPLCRYMIAAVFVIVCVLFLVVDTALLEFNPPRH